MEIWYELRQSVAYEGEHSVTEGSLEDIKAAIRTCVMTYDVADFEVIARVRAPDVYELLREIEKEDNV